MSAYLCVDNVRVCASVPVCGQRPSAQLSVCVCVCVCVRAEYRVSACGCRISAASLPTGGHKPVECECLHVVAGRLCTA